MSIRASVFSAIQNAENSGFFEFFDVGQSDYMHLALDFKDYVVDLFSVNTDVIVSFIQEYFEGE